ncbi:MAG: hypothetical protein ACLFVF_07390, partial [Thiohalospira sp.]
MPRKRTVLPLALARLATAAPAPEPAPRPRDPPREPAQQASPGDETAEADTEAAQSEAAGAPSEDDAAQDSAAGAENGGAAQERISSEAGNAASDTYAGEVMRHLSRVRRPSASGPGSAFVSFTVAPSGELESIEISESSGSSR